MCIWVKNHTDDYHTLFDVDLKGRILAVGNASGEVLIYDLDHGTLVNHLLPKRGKRPVLCCALSLDCK
jgi:hypothetical protein